MPTLSPRASAPCVGRGAPHRAAPALTLMVGSVRPLDTAQADARAYLREADGQRVLVTLNLGATLYTLDLGHVAASGSLLLSTDLGRAGSIDLARLQLSPDEGLVMRVMLLRIASLVS